MYVPSYLLCCCIFLFFFLFNCLPYLVNKGEYIINLTAQYTLHSAQKVMSATSEKPVCMIESEVKHIGIKIRSYIVSDRARWLQVTTTILPQLDHASTAVRLLFHFHSFND